MFDEFAPGMMFPRPEDVDRLTRYEQAEKIYEGKHYDIKEAKRIAQKLAHNREFRSWTDLNTEGAVFLIYNLPRMICDKFADLQVLQAPIINLEDNDEEEEFKERLIADVPELWSRLHDASSMVRAYGDVGLTATKEPETGRLDIRVVHPCKWFPVLDSNDPMRVLAHQIAWTEDHEVDRKNKTFLRVDVCYPDRIERRAFELESKSQEHQGNVKIKAQVDLGTLWEGLAPIDEADLGGLPSFVHLSNGSLEAGEIFGRPEFIDSGSLIDDINTRLSAWSDANDKVSHPPRIIPKGYLRQDEQGNVSSPSMYERVFIGSGRSDENKPEYLTFELAHETLAQQFDRTLTAFLTRHEMAPALLGIQYGMQKESGEAKSLGMGTTEARTRRDLLRIQPRVDRILTVLARLAGYAKDKRVNTHWRVGLPKSQDELVREIRDLRNLGVITRKQIIERIYPWFDAGQIDELLAELDKERDAEMAAVTGQFGAEVG